ncbi:hypothetical protein IT399_00835 [Candidatus Nomurabacteria bacterium]|nr:hypothetical protein [Candidatus Nomurabacteria bacterium]
MKEKSPENYINTRKITDEEALYFVEHLTEGQEIFSGKERLVFVKNISNGKKVVLIDPEHLDKNGKPPKHTFLKEILVDIIKQNPINIQDFGATVKKSDPELEEFRKAQKKAVLLEKIGKEGLPFIETLSVSEIKDKDVAKKIAEVKKFAKIGEESPYGKLSIKEIKERALKNKGGKVKAPQQIEAKESWTEKILKKVEEKRKKVLETFVKKSGYYGKLVLKGATALVASVGILHGELGRNTEIYTSANTKVEEPAPKQETAEEILKKIEGQFAEKNNRAEQIREEYEEREDFAQNAFRKGEVSAKEAFENPISGQTVKKEEGSTEAPVFETVYPLEINPEKDLELRKQAEEEAIKDYLKSLENGQTVTNETNEKEEGVQELSAPTPEQVYEAESTPTKVEEEIIPEPEPVSPKEQEEIKPTLVEYHPLTPETIKNKEDLISYVCENEYDQELRWGQLKYLKADEVIKHKGISSVDPAFERLAKCLREFRKKIGEPKRNLLGMRDTVESYVNKWIKSFKK